MTASAADQLNPETTAEIPAVAYSRTATRDSLLIFVCGVILFTFGPMPEFIGFQARFGLALPAAVVCSYHLWGRRWKALVVTVISAGILMVLCLAGLLAAARAQGGDGFVKAVLHAQMTGRMYDKNESIVYYWLRGFTAYAPAYPLAVIVIVSRLKNILRRDGDADQHPLGSLAAPCVIMKERTFRSLPADGSMRMRLLVGGKIGHRDFVALTPETSQSG